MKNNPQKGTSAALIVGIIAIIAVLAGAGFFILQSNPTSQNDTQTGQSANPTLMVSPGDEAVTTYKNGTYNTEGNYVSPGGPESIDVTVTLTDGIITDANVVSNAQRPMSKKMQEQFISGYKAQVIGKNIDEIELTKVSGSSLTPKGFNEALEEIKIQAKA